PNLGEASFDFNLGYTGAGLMALGFLTMGALVMYGTGEQFADSGAVFAGQLVQLYTDSLGQWSRPIILAAAFTTMFSTTLTVVDAFPRVLRRAVELIFPASIRKRDSRPLYIWLMLFVVVISLVILQWLGKTFTTMVDLATILSFLTAPVLGYINYRVVTSQQMPDFARPKKGMRVLSWMGLIFLSGFTLLFLFWRLFVA
ncbi:MAG TPA: divalent metal cation transporter, partial [bacterium]|nr:divalent metal cation transporter [bacterium]